MSLIAFGRHTVSNLIKSHFFSLKKVLLLSSVYRQDKEWLNYLTSSSIKYESVNSSQLVSVYSDKKDQGIIAIINNYYYFPFNDLVIKKPNRKFRIIVMLDGIEDPHNFGSIIRTTSALNIDGIIIGEKNQVLVNNTVIKISSGGIAYIPISKVSNLNNALEELKLKNFSIISTICDKKAIVYSQLNLDKDVCIVFGNEHSGIRTSIIKKSNELIYIPMFNEMKSLNVGVSCGIICAHLTK